MPRLSSASSQYAGSLSTLASITDGWRLRGCYVGASG
jgi:hypothetical protein